MFTNWDLSTRLKFHLRAACFHNEVRVFLAQSSKVKDTREKTQVLFMMVLLLLLLMTQAFTGTVLARWFDCRRPGQDCSQGRSCQSDGKCDCLSDVSSANCRYSSPSYYDGGLMCSNDLQCAPNSRCFNSSLTHVAEVCVCQDGFHGDKCQLGRAGIQCFGDRVALSLFPINFIGKIYPLESLMGNKSKDTCYLMPTRLQADNPDLAAFPFGFGHSRLFHNDSNPCLADPITTEQSDKVVYMMKYLMQYNDNYISNYDEIITVECHVAKFPTDPITMTVDIDPVPFSWLLQNHRHEQSIENFIMVVSYVNGTIVGSDDLLPIGTSLVAKVSLTEQSNLADVFIKECDIRPEEDDSQNAILIYKDGCVIQRYGLAAGDPNIRGYSWVEFLLPRFPQSPKLVLSCVVIGCEAGSSCQEKLKRCGRPRKRREEERFPVQPETTEKQRLSWLLRVESDLPMTETKDDHVQASDHEMSALIISACVFLIASVVSLAVCAILLLWSKWMSACLRGRNTDKLGC